MGRKIKNFLLIGVLALLAIRIFTPNNQTHPEKTTVFVDWSRVADNTNETRRLKWQGIITHVSGRPGSQIQKTLEKDFNLEIQPIFMDINGFSNRRPLMLCSGDIPDVIWDGDPLGVRANQRNGFIMEIPYEIILQRAPTYVNYLNEYGKQAWLYSYKDGKNYGLPTFFAGANRPRIGTWRLDWLKKAGFDRTPETIEEMYRALHFFRYGDPDGNGKKDTFGWSPDIGHWSMFFAEVFAANNVLPFDFMQRNGSIIWGGVLPEAKQTLATLRQWYQDELIDPDFPLDSQQLIGDRKFINGKTGYLYPVDYWREYDLTNPNSLYGRIRSFNPSAEITPAPPLRDTQGRRRGRTWGGAGHILQFGCQLEQEPEKVFRVLDMMETITRSESLYMTTRFGVRGSQWEYKPGKGMALIPPYENNKTLQEAELLVPQIGTCFFYPSTLEPAYDNQYMIPPIIEFDETYRKTAWGLMNVLGKSDVVPSAGRYLGDLRNYQTTVFLGIILGQRDLSDFDKFVDEWYRRGGDILTREANETYKTMRSIWKRVGATEDEL